MARKFTINDNDRDEWVNNDEGLHGMFLYDRKSGRANNRRKWIQENRAEIDAVIRRATGNETEN